MRSQRLAVSRPLNDLLSPVHPVIAVDLAAQQQFLLRGVPERIVGLARFHLLAGIDRVPLVLGVLPQSRLGPVRQGIQRLGIAREAREIEGQLAADNQFFQEFIGDQLMLLGIALAPPAPLAAKRYVRNADKGSTPM